MVSELISQFTSQVPDRLQFLCDGSTFANIALAVLVLSSTLYLITRAMDWLVLFCSAVLYLLPLVLRGY